MFGNRSRNVLADDGVHGVELWETDGTAAGTRLVADICLGACSSYPVEFSPVGDVVLFDAEGTTFIREISPARATSGQGRWVAAGGLVFFAVNDGAVGHELWATDGTAAGTRLVRDICAGPCDGVDILRGTPLDGLVYFAAQTRGGIREIWRSDGTSPGTFSLGMPFTGDPRATVSRGRAGAVGFGRNDRRHGPGEGHQSRIRQRM